MNERQSGRERKEEQACLSMCEAAPCLGFMMTQRVVVMRDGQIGCGGGLAIKKNRKNESPIKYSN